MSSRPTNWLREALFAVGTLAAQSAGVWAITPGLTRSLTAIDYGIVAQNMVVAITLAQFLSLGLGSAVTRLHHTRDLKAGSKSLVGAGVLAAVVLGAPLVALPDLVLPLLATETSVAVARLTMLYAIAVSGVNLIAIYLRTAGRASSAGIAALTVSVTAPAAGIGLVLATGGAVTAFFLAATTTSFVVLVTFWVLVQVNVRVTRPLAARSLRIALPTVPHLASRQVLDVGDRIIIGAVLGSAAVGEYHAAYLVGSAPLLLLGAINNAWSPSVYARKELSRWSYLNAAQGHLIRLSVAASVATFCVIPYILPIVYPDASDEMSIAASLIAVVAPMQSTYLVASAAMFAVERIAAIAIVSVLSAVVNVGLTLLLAPLGLGWAALSTAVTVSMLAMVLLAVAIRSTPLKWPDRRTFAMLGLPWVVLAVVDAAPAERAPAGMVIRVVLFAIALGAGKQAVSRAFESPRALVEVVE